MKSQKEHGNFRTCWPTIGISVFTENMNRYGFVFYIQDSI